MLGLKGEMQFFAPQDQQNIRTTKRHENTQKIQKTQIRTRETKNNSYKGSELIRRKRFYKKTTLITFSNSNHFTDLDQDTRVEIYFFIEKENTKNPLKHEKTPFNTKIRKKHKRTHTH